MSRRYRDPVERGVGAGEIFAFLLVVAATVMAFTYVGSSSHPSVARVVSMSEGVSLGDRTASVVPAEAFEAPPIPTRRPD